MYMQDKLYHSTRNILMQLHEPGSLQHYSLRMVQQQTLLPVVRPQDHVLIHMQQYHLLVLITLRSFQQIPMPA